MTRQRWAYILDFLATEEASIKSALASAIHEDMIRADVFLINATMGEPEIVTEVMEPSGGEKLLVWSVKRPAMYRPNLIKMEIQEITYFEMISTLVNQIDVE